MGELSVALMVGLSVGVIGGLVSGLLGGLTDTVKVDKASPNEGIKLSGKNATIAFVISFLIFGVILGLTFAVLIVLYGGLIGRLYIGLFFELIGGGLGVGLIRGGSAVAKHFALRLIL